MTQYLIFRVGRWGAVLLFPFRIGCVPLGVVLWKHGAITLNLLFCSIIAGRNVGQDVGS